MWKNNTFNMLSLLDIQYTGTILFDDIDYKSKSDKERANFRRNHIGYVFQKQNLISFLSVEENQHIYDTEKIIDKTSIHELSQGQQETKILDSVLNQNKDIFLLDEVLSSLDIKNRNRFIPKIIEKSKICLVILVSHDVSLEKEADQVYLMEDKALTKIKDNTISHPKPATSTKEEFKISWKRIIPRFLSSFKLISLITSFCFSLLFALCYIGLESNRNDAFFSLLFGLQSEKYIIAAPNHNNSSSDIKKAFPNKSYEIYDEDTPIVYFEEEKDDNQVYCSQKTYDQFIENDTDEQTYHIVNGELRLLRESYKIQINNNLTDGFFYHYRSTKSSLPSSTRHTSPTRPTFREVVLITSSLWFPLPITSKRTLPIKTINSRTIPSMWQA